MTITDHGSSGGAATGAPIAGRREWIGLMVLGLANLLYVMDLTVLKLAVPAIGVGLQPSGTQLLWIIDISGFFVAGSLITMGTVGDRIGHRKLLLAGTAAFGVGSVLAAFSTSVEMLIGSRALWGWPGRLWPLDPVADLASVPGSQAAIAGNRNLDRRLRGRRRARAGGRRAAAGAVLEGAQGRHRCAGQPARRQGAGGRHQVPVGSARKLRRRAQLTGALRRTRNRPGGYWVAAADP